LFSALERANCRTAWRSGYWVIGSSCRNRSSALRSSSWARSSSRGGSGTGRAGRLRGSSACGSRTNRSRTIRSRSSARRRSSLRTRSFAHSSSWALRSSSWARSSRCGGSGTGHAGRPRGGSGDGSKTTRSRSSAHRHSFLRSSSSAHRSSNWARNSHFRPAGQRTHSRFRPCRAPGRRQASQRQNIGSSGGLLKKREGDMGSELRAPGAGGGVAWMVHAPRRPPVPRIRWELARGRLAARFSTYPELSSRRVCRLHWPAEFA
jgi:hypothetical protein